MTSIPNANASLLIVDDDPVFRQLMGRAMGRFGYQVQSAADVPEALALLADQPDPDVALIDLKMPGPSGLALVEALHQRSPATRILVLTGYASIATAVEAVKLGAINYLAKPVTAEEVQAALQRTEPDSSVDVQADRLSVERLTWEHIQRVLAEHDGNISATARALNMHRRTLQRRLAKRAPGR